MPVPANLRLFLTFISIACLNACAPSITIESQKAPQSVAQPQRLFIDLEVRDTLVVPSNMWQPQHDEVDTFGTYSVKTLEKCGIKAAYKDEKFLSLKEPREKPFGDFSPDTVLRIVVSSEQPTGAGVLSAVYQLSLIDIKKAAIIWHAKVKLDMQGRNMKRLGPALAKEILGKMQSDDLIPQSCSLDIPDN